MHEAALLSLTPSGLCNYPVAAPLSALVQSIWTLDAGSDGCGQNPELMHPDGGNGLIFCFSGQAIIDGKPLAMGCTVTGPFIRSQAFYCVPHTRLLGVRFQPAAATALFPFPLVEIKNTLATSETLGLGELCQLYSRLQEMTTVREQTDYLVQWLQHQLVVNLTDARRQTLISQRLKDPFTRIKDVAGELGISERTLIRWSSKTLGIHTKEYAQILRLEQARTLLKQPSLGELSELALSLNFCDQAHFNRQFKSMTGLTPGQYRALKTGA